MFSSVNLTPTNTKALDGISHYTVKLLLLNTCVQISTLGYLNISHKLFSLVLATGRRVQGKQFVINISGLKQNRALKNLTI
jgi:hypothetical protein